MENYATASASPVRQPEVSGEMDRLTAECETLDKGVTELEQKLMTILAQRSEESAGNANPEPVRVPLAQAIHDRSSHVAQMSNRIQSIINRIEV